jgi:aspartate/methionine/tyrosine aminotransferase
MFAPVRYLEWARRFYGQVRFDLATSGMPTVPASEIPLPEGAPLDGAAAWALLPHAIAAHHGTSAEEAIAALGTTHAMWLACAAVAGPGDDVLVEDPAYEPLVRIAEGVGARPVRFRREAAEGYAVDPERVARAMTPRTRLIVLTSPHNPSGVRASDEALAGCARLAMERGAWLLVNEIYAELDDLVGPDGVFRGSARRLGPRVLAASSLTKCYGLGPHRIGWLLGPPDVIARARDVTTAAHGMLPLSHAHFALAAFARLPELAARTRGTLAPKRARVGRWVAEQGLSWSAPEAGLFGFVRTPGRGDLTLAIEAAARSREVLVAPGAFFGEPEGFRIAWSLPDDALEEGLARLATVL